MFNSSSFPFLAFSNCLTTFFLLWMMRIKWLKWHLQPGITHFERLCLGHLDSDITELIGSTLGICEHVDGFWRQTMKEVTQSYPDERQFLSFVALTWIFLGRKFAIPTMNSLGSRLGNHFSKQTVRNSAPKAVSTRRTPHVQSHPNSPFGMVVKPIAIAQRQETYINMAQMKANTQSAMSGIREMMMPNLKISNLFVVCLSTLLTLVRHMEYSRPPYWCSSYFYYKVRCFGQLCAEAETDDGV